MRVVEPASNYEIEAIIGVYNYPFKVSKLMWVEAPTLRFSCDPGQKIYARLAISKSEQEATGFIWVNESRAKEVMKDLPVLLGYYVPGLLH